MGIALWLALAGCGAPEDVWTFPDPDAGPAWLGPGGPAVALDGVEPFTPCAYLDPGPADRHDVHNGVYPWRGYAVMPFARDIGEGGVALFDVSDPCLPARVGVTAELSMRETHTAAFAHLEGDRAGDWMVATDLLGVQFWDLSDPTEPRLAHRMQLPGVTFVPGSYPRTVHSAWWQVPWLYVAGADNGLYVVDASDPLAPVLVDQVVFDPPLRAGFVTAMGSTLYVGGSEESEALLLDISDPAAPRPIPGGRFQVADGDGVPREAYASSLAGPWALFARTEDGSGVIAFDLTDREAPAYVADLRTEGNGGYVFHDEGHLFVGESDVARVLSFDGAEMRVVGEVRMPGDLDTLMPYGNVALLSADEEAEQGQATAVVPWRAEVDTTGPVVLHTDPSDGATGVAPTARLGIGFSEFIEPSSAFAGSLRLWGPDGEAVPGSGSAQESIAAYTPLVHLEPGTYTAEVVAGGVMDANGNAVAETHAWTFTVGPAR